MPVYEYKCRSCGTKFQKLVRPSDSPVVCTKCGGGEVSKLFSTFACAGVKAGGAASSSGCASCSGGHCSTCH